MSEDASNQCPHAKAHGVPEYDVDFYADDVIRHPWDHYAAMRTLGSVIWLPRHRNFAFTRYAAVREALRNWKVFSSASGVAGDDFGCQFLRGNTLMSDPPRHDEMRAAMATPLLPAALEGLRESIEVAAVKVVDRVVGSGGFDGMADFARKLPLSLVTELVGLPDDGRANMLNWAAASFNILGVQNERGRRGVETLTEMRQWIATKATLDRLKPGSWTARIHELARDGAIPVDFVPHLFRDYINPSLDTTISATGHLIYQLGRNPEQWELLRADPTLAANAVNEAVRIGSPIRSFTRTLTQDCTIDGVDMPRGARAMMLYASANRDERRFENPDRFDIARRDLDHLGFGHGVHACAGMHLARMEMESLLKAMMSRVDRITVGEPEIALNNTIQAFSRLPVIFHPVAASASKLATGSAASGAIEVRVIDRRQEAENIISLQLARTDDKPLESFTAGSHIDVVLGDGMIRQYSLCGRPGAEGPYRIAILREEPSRGGSVAAHDRLKAGATLRIGFPRNLFPLDETGSKYILIAGGIGITPILSMAHRLHEMGGDFELHYAARSEANAAFLEELHEAPFRRRVSIYLGTDPSGMRLDPRRVLSGPRIDGRVYCCGPARLNNAVAAAAKATNWPVGSVRFERFSVGSNDVDTAFTVVARRSNLRLVVPVGRTILQVLEEAGVSVGSSCQSGVCGTCLTSVVEGLPEHRDQWQSDEEKATNRQMTICCSRSLTREIVIDI